MPVSDYRLVCCTPRETGATALNHSVPGLFRVLGSRVGGERFLCLGRRFGLAGREGCASN